MKLKLRIGRQRAEPIRADEVRTESSPADRVREPQPVTVAGGTASATVPVPRAQERGVVKAGSFCRASDIGQRAVTASGRAVVSVPSGRCGRWVYVDGQ
ncbi:hypothetical protein ABH926_006745 [Catenulispora sp. GP43]|uniref:hypothetical protein n=1 Tax=Catenulispora sp. GP43 TaxID=3156263 RepID=UPI0035125D5A